ncbi:hypothetical protein APHNP_0140 [Anaplasma phagocytophilum str. ApNP]|uniref:Uncharacterized protein n=1 Tax=Anaplasma phagocytophilum str. ApNP TaxID=1359153 RepID=A0A0F3NF47_ANAPH|nr:hypothetical protein APHNP_0140 [Anaplasma phagocytophilum str. ApNP]
MFLLCTGEGDNSSSFVFFDAACVNACVYPVTTAWEKV